MIERIDGNILTIDGKRYNVVRDLECLEEASGRQKTYLRKPTKIRVYKELRDRDSELYDNLTRMIWFKEEYMSEVEGGQVEPTHTAQAMEGMNIMNNDTLEKLTKAIESISDRKILDFDKAQTTQFISDTLDKLVKERLLIQNPTLEIKLPTGETHKVDGLKHKIFDRVLEDLSAHLNVYITGPAGTGKNHMCEQIAQALGVPFYIQGKISMGHEHELTGFINAQGDYVESNLYKALKNKDGGVFFFDEFDASSPDAATQINCLLANGYYTFPNNEMVHMNDKFYVICAGNTVGTGADMIYTGRNVLDGATLDRFILEHMDYDENLENHLCPDRELKEFIYDIRRSAKKNNVNAIVGMRCLINSYKLLSLGRDKQTIVHSAILKGMGQDDINILKGGMNSSNDWFKYMNAYQD